MYGKQPRRLNLMTFMNRSMAFSWKQILWVVLYNKVSFHFHVYGNSGCESDDYRKFDIKTNIKGSGLCVHPTQEQSVLSIVNVQHLGECLRACALEPNCTVYSYRFDRNECQLDSSPLQYAVVPGCFSYLVRCLITMHRIALHCVFLQCSVLQYY